MRRDIRKNNKDEMSMKIIKCSAIAVAILTVIVFGVLIYSKKLNDTVKEGTLTGEQISSILNNTTNQTENTESASSEIGKSVNEMANELNANNAVTNSSNLNANTTTNKSTKSNNVLSTNQINSNKMTETKSKTEEKAETKTVELNFVKPVEGDIVRDFAVDSLVYSDTLQEWTTHTGIDIKADKTTVVKSAEAGIVKTIKNDPRYGLTVIVEHENGFQTVYSNLLTSEFVVEGEKVEKGQSLGTVGNTAAFEIADEPHLHFEILKDSVQVDPNIYLK